MPIIINIPEVKDSWDPVKEEFVSSKGYTLNLEHSLISLQLWESKWKKPFLTSEKNPAELIDYIKCMTINKGIPDEAYERIPMSEMTRINDYIKDPMSATVIYDLTPNKKKVGNKKSNTPTAERIYYWMISCNIPSEYRKWHLNQLLTLIRVFDVENNTEKMSKTDSAAWRRQQNAARRKAMHSKG